MRVISQELFIPKKELKLTGLDCLREHYYSHIRAKFPTPHRVIRFVITKSKELGYHCEFDLIIPENEKSEGLFRVGTIFDFRRRTFENVNTFNVVLLIPTGIGAQLGGHCGDGNAVARFVASACDTLITHPNVVNASDINEMTENTLYVEGSVITRLLMGQIGLQRVKSNRILMLMDKHKERLFNNEVINAVSSARITLGIDCDVHEMKEMVNSVPYYSESGRAVGKIGHLERLFKVIRNFRNDYDSIALSTFIKVPKNYHRIYFQDDKMINPWGGIESMLTHSIAEVFDIPCAHSPMMASSEVMNFEVGIVDPRKAPETSSVTYLHCILKGLHKAPRIVESTKGLTLEDVSCIVIPDGCVGLPVLACLENDIPVIAVKENRNNMKNDLRNLPFKKNKLFVVDNYLEAVGVLVSLKAGISLRSVRRPIENTLQI